MRARLTPGIASIVLLVLSAILLITPLPPAWMPTTIQLTLICGAIAFAIVQIVLTRRTVRIEISIGKQLKETSEALNQTRRVEEITASRLRESVLNLKDFLATLGERVNSHASAYAEISSMMEEFQASVETSTQATGKQLKIIDSINEQAEQVEILLRRIWAAGDDLQNKMEEARASGESVTEEAGDLTQAFTEIENAFETVADVTQIMTEISDRTNLLSLNASIEAARAGEQGRGFAIVAQEINKLADKSSDNAEHIVRIVTGNQSAIGSAHSVADLATNRIQEQRSAFQIIAERYSVVTESVREQIQKNEQLVQTIRQLRNLSGEIGGVAREQKTSIDAAMQSLVSMESSTTNLVGEARLLEKSVRLIEEQAQSLHSDYHVELRRVEEWLLSRLRHLLSYAEYEADQIDPWIESIEDDIPGQCFRVYICDDAGTQLSSNFTRTPDGFRVQPEFRGSNWSSRPFFVENMSRVKKSGEGSLSDRYIDREFERETVTFTYRLTENTYLFLDLEPDFARMTQQGVS